MHFFSWWLVGTMVTSKTSKFLCSLRQRRSTLVSSVQTVCARMVIQQTRLERSCCLSMRSIMVYRSMLLHRLHLWMWLWKVERVSQSKKGHRMNWLIHPMRHVECLSGSKWCRGRVLSEVCRNYLLYLSFFFYERRPDWPPAHTLFFGP